MTIELLKDSILGQKVYYPKNYTASVLYPIKRIKPDQNGAVTTHSYGYDIWNCYEMSWLGKNFKPEVRILTIIIPSSSKNIIESKSLKLYLNSFNNSYFASEEEVLQLIKQDLQERCEWEIYLQCYKLTEYVNIKLSQFDGINLDDIELLENISSINNNLMINDNIVQETLYSNLLRSNCPVTNQPDWASIQIKYTGHQINHKSLLQYILSLRDNMEFHENCIERIFSDIYTACQPSELTVYARYTRRGGIDINPIRSIINLNVTELLNLRQPRQ